MRAITIGGSFDNDYYLLIKYFDSFQFDDTSDLIAIGFYADGTL